jgi:peptidoglycan-associated lipoprotein
MKNHVLGIVASSCIVLVSAMGCSSTAPDTELDTPPVTEVTTPPPPPPPTVVKPPPPPKEVVLATVYFDFDQHKLDAAAKDLLSSNARVMKDNGDVMVLIEGHCDERGSEEYNLALGEKRANSVRDYLVDLGVTTSRIQTLSYGEERPALSGTSESSWSLNRRAAFVRTDQ